MHSPFQRHSSDFAANSSRRAPGLYVRARWLFSYPGAVADLFPGAPVGGVTPENLVTLIGGEKNAPLAPLPGGGKKAVAGMTTCLQRSNHGPIWIR
jgi:hypothetical protein